MARYPGTGKWKRLDVPADNLPVLRTSAAQVGQASHAGRVESVGSEAAVRSQAVDVHWLWNETRNRLERYRHAVAEGKELDGAIEFARYVLWSGLEKVLRPHDNNGELKVDSSHLVWLAEELQREVQACYSAGKGQPGEAGTLRAIDHKLDLIAGHVARLGQPAGSAAAAEPPLAILQGGVS